MSDHYSKYSKTVPHHVLAERLHGLAGQTEAVETRAILIFKLITLLIPPANRRKLQLLLKFIRKVTNWSRTGTDPYSCFCRIRIFQMLLLFLSGGRIWSVCFER